MATKAAPATATTYQLKVTIAGTKPPVWRRFRVPGKLTLGELHSILQIAFEWTDTHLHEFVIGKNRYGSTGGAFGDFDDEERLDEDKTRLEQALKATKKFRYIYDFGDDWIHEIAVEKAEPAKPEETGPVCLDGKRHGPPEDCGGPWGYSELLDAISDPTDERHTETVAWVGRDFDPEDFSVTALNRLLGA